MTNNLTKSYPENGEPCWIIEDAAGVKDYKIKIWFRDGLIKIVDLKDRVLGCESGSVFEPLKDPKYFSAVEFSEELGTVCWPNEADFSPEYLYENGVNAISSREKVRQKKKA